MNEAFKKIANAAEAMEDCVNRKKAYEIVFEDLKKVPLFVGRYDGKRHGEQKKYMHGISSVMEYIAYEISEEEGDAYCDLFLLNMRKSEDGK